jgi:hypothetical protein
MSSHITARVTRPIIATAIAAICFGTVTVPVLAATTAPAVASAAPHTTIGQVTPNCCDNPWP